MPDPNQIPPLLGMGPVAVIGVGTALAAAILVPLWQMRKHIGWEILTYFGIVVPLALAGLIVWELRRGHDNWMGIVYVIGMLLLAFAGMGAFLGVIEFGLLRILGLFQLGAISRITYYEALLQPFTYLVLFGGITTIGLTARLNFFTYNEDFKMYRDVASSFVFLFTLPVMVFAATKVIDDEIENRTMLTLMSKPVSRTQVVVGKYLGVLVLIVAAVGVLGIMAGMCSYLRFFDDMGIDYRVGEPAETARLDLDNYKALLALYPSLVLTFLQVATLGAISVAVSTRFGLAVNVTVVVMIYIAASLARYVGNAPELPSVVRGTIGVFSYLLPGLSFLDLNQRLVFSNFVLGENDWAPNMPTYGLIWKYVGLSAAYSLFYITAILSFGVALFRSRELS